MPVNHQTITQTSVSVYSGHITSDIVQLARDAVTGSTGDYFLFQYTDTEYVLLMSDNMEYEDGTLTMDSFDCIDFVYDEQTNTLSYSESGNTSGNAWGNFGGAQYSGSYNGSVYVPVADRTYYQWFYSSDQPLTVSNTGHYVTYGSFEGLPHLREGIENYAWSQIALVVGICVFCLADRIFRRVSD